MKGKLHVLAAALVFALAGCSAEITRQPEPEKNAPAVQAVLMSYLMTPKT